MSESRSVLIVSHDFAPVGTSVVQRVLHFARYLPEYGWNATILCAAPSPYKAWDFSLLNTAESLGIRIIRTGEFQSPEDKQIIPPQSSRSAFRRKLNDAVSVPEAAVRWSKEALHRGRELLRGERFDVIMATAPPFTDFLVARQLAEEFNLPHVVDYQDLWVDNPFHFHASPMHKARNIAHETAVLKTSERILVTSRHIKESLLRRHAFLGHNDIEIIPHGYDPADFDAWQGVHPDPARFTITHSGKFVEDRTPKYFLHAWADFLRVDAARREHCDARFIGALSKNERKLINKYKVAGNVTATGYVPHTEAIRQLMESDVLWMMCRFNVRSSGKLFEYIGARKPLLVCAPEGNIRTSAKNSGAAVVTAPADVDAIKQALELFYNLWQNNKLPAPNEDFVERYDRRRLSGDLARVLGMAMRV